MHSLVDDLRYAIRGFRKNPGIAVVAVLSLGIGIGANAAIFGLMDRLLFRSLAVPDPQSLVLLRSPGGWSGSINTSYGDDVSFSWLKYQRLVEQSGSVFEGLLARAPFDASIAARGQTDAARGELVSGNYFDLLGLRPAAGRLLTPGDSRSRENNPVAVLSHGYWQRRFGGDPAILNQTITVNGVPLTVVGIARPGFGSVGAGESPDVFAPVTMAPKLMLPWAAQALENSHAYWLNVFGRLRPGTSRPQAAAAMGVIWPQVLAVDVSDLPARSTRERYLAKVLELLDGANGISSIREDVRVPLYLLMGMVGLVLLIACANIANLLLARAVARGKETAIRISLGASRSRLIRQVLAESLLLSVAGGVVGLAALSWAGPALRGLLPADMPVESLGTEFDPRVLLFATAVTLLTGLLFGCAPALRATRPDLGPVLKQGASAAPGQARLRRALVAGQIAVSALMLASAGLFTHSLHNLRSLDPGFRAGGVAAFSLNPRLLGYPPERSLRLFDELRRELSQTPGVAGVSMSKWTVLANMIDQRPVLVEGYQPPPGSSNVIHDNMVGPGFFGVMGIPILAGREFRDSDTLGAPGVAVVNESFARKFFEGGNPVGRRFTMRRDGPSFEIVGLAKDAKYDDLREKPKPFVYFASAQDRNAGPITFYVRNSLTAETVASTVRDLTRRLEPAMPVEGPRPLGDQILTSVFVDRMVAMFATTFAVAATALAAIGLYGVIAWAVSRRRREIGIRMALGAEPASVLRMVLGDVLRLGLTGVVIAAPLWVIAGRLLKTLLFGVTEHDPTTLAAALAVILSVALAAGLLPAWRASRIDPNAAIRHD